MKELSEQFASLMDDLKCCLCNTVFKQKHKLLLHIGCKHGKINDVLKQKGFAVLPAPLLNTPNHAMQKQLIQIKKERMDQETEVTTDKSDKFEDFDFTDSTNKKKSDEAAAASTTPAAPAFNPGPFSTELSEILKKYSNLAPNPSV